MQPCIRRKKRLQCCHEKTCHTTLLFSSTTRQPLTCEGPCSVCGHVLFSSTTRQPLTYEGPCSVSGHVHAIQSDGLANRIEVAMVEVDPEGVGQRFRHWLAVLIGLSHPILQYPDLRAAVPALHPIQLLPAAAKKATTKRDVLLTMGSESMWA